MALTKIRLKRYEELQAYRYLHDGLEMASNMRDGQIHFVEVIFTIWKEYLFGHKIRTHRWLSLVVDDKREAGGKLGVGEQVILHRYKVYAADLPRKKQSAQSDETRKQPSDK